MDPVLARDLATEVERCRVPAQPAAPPVVAPPAAPPTTNPNLGPVGVASNPIGNQAVAPTPPSREEDDTEDENEDEGEDQHEDEDENENEHEDEGKATDVDHDHEDEKVDKDEAADPDTEYDNRVIKITGIPLREEIFEILEEAIDDLAAHGQDDELERIKTSLFDLRRACAVSDLLALVKTLTTISRSFQRGKLVKTLLVM